MKEKIIYMTAALLGISLLGGCGSKATEHETEHQMGRYVEKQSAFSGGDLYSCDAIRTLTDGTVVMIGASDDEYIFQSKDNGTTWETREYDLSEAGDEAAFQNPAISQDGRIAFSNGDYEEDDAGNYTYTTQIWLLNPDGSLDKLDTNLPELVQKGKTEKPSDEDLDALVEKMVKQGAESAGISEDDYRKEMEGFGLDLKEMVRSMASSGADDLSSPITGIDFTDDIFLQLGDSKIYQISGKTGKLINTYNTGLQLMLGWKVAGNYLIAAGSGQVVVYDIQTGDMVSDDEMDLLTNQLGEGSFILQLASSVDGKTLYMGTVDGIFSHIMGEDSIDTVLDGTMSSLCDVSFSFTGMNVMANGDILMFGGEENYDSTSVLSQFSYCYDKDMPTYPDKKLKLYALSDDSPNTVKNFIAKFQKDHPDIYVEYTRGISGEEGGTTADALRVLNTQILAGEGPDVILLDGMSISTYAGNGMLEDMTDLVNAAKESGNLFEHVAEGYQLDDATYAIPLRFTVPMIIGSKEELDGLETMEDLANLVDKLAKDPDNKTMIMSALTPQEILANLFIGNSGNLFHKDGTLNREELTQFLTIGKQMYESANKNTTGFSKQLMDIMSQLDEEGKAGNMTVSDSMGNPIQDADKIFFRSVHFGMGAGGSGGGSFLNFTTAVESGDDIIYRTIPSANQKVFVGEHYIGINSQGKQIDLAKEFVTFMLGEEAQSYSGAWSGYSLNKDLMLADLKQNVANNASDGGQMSAEDADGNTQSVDYVEPDDAFYQSYMDYIDNLTEPMYTETQVENTIMDMGKGYLRGKAKLDETVDQIITKMDLYLSE